MTGPLDNSTWRSAPGEAAVHRDREALGLPVIVAGAGALAGLLALKDGLWVIAGMVVAMVGVVVLVVPHAHRITLEPDGAIRLRTPLRVVHATPESLVTVKLVYPGEWREHLSIRTRGRLAMTVRHRVATDNGVLAAALLELFRSAPAARIDPRALKALDKLVSRAS